MANMSVASSITVLHDEKAANEEISTLRCPAYLWRREAAERAAAKRSRTPIADTSGLGLLSTQSRHSAKFIAQR